MKPPAVGSGCKVTSVATGSRSSGRASSPTRVSPSAVCSSMSSRRAGRIVPDRISWTLTRGPSRARRWGWVRLYDGPWPPSTTCASAGGPAGHACLRPATRPREAGRRSAPGCTPDSVSAPARRRARAARSRHRPSAVRAAPCRPADRGPAARGRRDDGWSGAWLHHRSPRAVRTGACRCVAGSGEPAVAARGDAEPAARVTRASTWSSQRHLGLGREDEVLDDEQPGRAAAWSCRR